METRDCQDGSAAEMDVLVELELEPGKSANDAMANMKEKGLKVFIEICLEYTETAERYF